MKSQANPNVTESNYIFHTTVKHQQINGKEMLEIDVPGDGSCQFYAVTFSFLLQALNKKDLFLQRFEILFGEINNIPEINGEKLYDALLKYKGDPNFIEQVPGLKTLINTLRTRVTDYNFKNHYDDLYAAAAYNGISIDIYIDEMKNGMGDEKTKKLAGGIEMLGMAKICNIDIEVRKKFGNNLQEKPDFTSIINDDTNNKVQDKIYLVYCNLKDKMSSRGNPQFNHYRFLIDPKFFVITSEEKSVFDKHISPAVSEGTSSEFENALQIPIANKKASVQNQETVVSTPTFFHASTEKTTSPKSWVQPTLFRNHIFKAYEHELMIDELTEATDTYLAVLIKHQDLKIKKGSVFDDLLSQKIRLIKECKTLLEDPDKSKLTILTDFKTKLAEKKNIDILVARRYQVLGLAHATKTFLKLVFLALPALLVDAVTFGYAGAYSSLFSVKGRDFVKDTNIISKNHRTKP